MQRWRKRLFSSGLIGGAVLLIVAAILVGTVRLVDVAAPRYRQELANRLTEVIQQPVEVGHINMSWQGFRPTVELDDVTVLDPDSRLPVFRLREILVPFSWSALFKGQFKPAQVILIGMAITLEWRTDGSLGVQGINMGREQAGELDLAEVFQQLRQLGHVVVRDSQLAWQEFGEPIGLTHLRHFQAELRAVRGLYELSVDAILPEALGGPVNLQIRMDGDIDQPEALKTSVSLHANTLSVNGWLRPLLQSQLDLHGDFAQVQVESTWRGLQPDGAQVRLHSPVQDVWSGDQLLGQVPGLSADISLQAEEQGWAANIDSLQYQDAAGPGPVSRGRLAYQPLAGGYGTELRGQLDAVRLSDLLAWGSVLAMTEGQRMPAGIGGDLQQLKFNYSAVAGFSPDFEIQGQLRRLQLPASETLPGVTGINGELSYDGDVAHMQLYAKRAELDLPKIFAQPVPLKKLQADLAVQRTTEGWELASRALNVSVDTLKAKGSLVFESHDDERPAFIDLRLDFSATDLVPLKALIPLPPVLPETAGDWLRGAIHAGKVPKGEFVLRGALADYPFVDDKRDAGEFRVAFDVRDAHLEYAREWPAVERVNAQVIFAGRGLSVTAESAQVLGMTATGVKANIETFKNPLLSISAHAQAGLDKQLSFLAHSPLKDNFEGVLEVLKLSGPGKLGVDLSLPLKDLAAVRVNGAVELQGGKLSIGDFEHPVEDLRGRVQFTETGLSAKAVRGRFVGLQAVADLTPEVSAQGKAMRLKASIPIVMPRDKESLTQLLGQQPVFDAMSGETTATLSARFEGSQGAPWLYIDTDLQGLTIEAGAPIGKAADQARPLRIGLLPQSNQLQVSWQFSHALSGRALWQAHKQGWQVERGAIALGEAQPVPVLPDLAGWSFSGSLPEIDMENHRFEGDSRLPEVNHVDVQIGSLKLAGQHFRDLGIRLDPQTQSLMLSGPDAEGQVRWQEREQRLLVDAHFKRLGLTAPKPMEATNGDEKIVPINPLRLPGLTLECETFVLGGEELGALQLKAVPIANGLRLDIVDLKGKTLEIRGGGEWTRIDGQSSGQLTVNVNSVDIRKLLKATGYAPSITAKQADIFTGVHWAPHPDGLTMEALNGELRLDLRDGSLLDVDPGAGRVLSLLSFYSLPRRLILDFRDVMGKGTAFDKLSGQFKITNGDAVTRDLKVKSASLEIEVNGRIGLAKRDYDQTVLIKPELSSSVTFAGVVFGGPVLGIGLWLAQELLDQPLEQASRLSYYIGGSWDDPVIKPLEVEPKLEPGRKGGKPGAKSGSPRNQDSATGKSVSSSGAVATTPRSKAKGKTRIGSQNPEADTAAAGDESTDTATDADEPVSEARP